MMNKKAFLTTLLVGIIAMLFFTGCDSEPHLKMLNTGNGEYLYVQRDQNVKGTDWLFSGYSLRSTKDDRVVHTFRSKPKEIRLEDFNGDGTKDLIYVISDPNVKGTDWLLNCGYSMRVALGKKNGTFCQAKVVSTFKSIS